METMHQEHPMFKLGNDDASVLHLGQLRWFLNETCRNWLDSTPILLNYTVGEETGIIIVVYLKEYRNLDGI